MTIDDEVLEKILAACERNPPRAVTLPAHAYGADGVAVIIVKGLSTPLHRHLHELLIRPLADDEYMRDQSGVVGNVNPRLFAVERRGSGRSARTHCHRGHQYAGNEMPPNSGGWRCRRCYREWRASRSNGRPSVTAINRAKTHCPRNHEYTTENTIINGDGKRRCRTCIADRRAAKRKENHG